MNEDARPTQDLLEPRAPAVAPVVPTPPDRRAGRARWSVAVAAALVILAVSAAGLYALVGAAAGSTVAKWAPADSLVFVEVRGDLPGDQRQNLGRFLAHFPGFADQSTLDQKLDETLDRLVEPGVGRQAGLDEGDQAVVRRPGRAGRDRPARRRSASEPSAGHELLIATISDPAGASAWIAGLGGPAPSRPGVRRDHAPRRDDGRRAGCLGDHAHRPPRRRRRLGQGGPRPERQRRPGRRRHVQDGHGQPQGRPARPDVCRH